jgi:hypothetical protein
MCERKASLGEREWVWGLAHALFCLITRRPCLTNLHASISYRSLFSLLFSLSSSSLAPLTNTTHPLAQSPATSAPPQREAALIEAVEALSAQNEDLISKLKKSMERELEASRRSKAQGQGQGRDQDMDGADMDHYGGGGGGRFQRSTSPPRAQSDTRLQRAVGGGGPKRGAGAGQRLPRLG